MRTACPRFNAWLTRLEARNQPSGWSAQKCRSEFEVLPGDFRYGERPAYLPCEEIGDLHMPWYRLHDAGIVGLTQREWAAPSRLR